MEIQPVFEDFGPKFRANKLAREKMNDAVIACESPGLNTDIPPPSVKKSTILGRNRILRAMASSVVHRQPAPTETQQTEEELNQMSKSSKTSNSLQFMKNLVSWNRKRGTGSASQQTCYKNKISAHSLCQCSASLERKQYQQPFTGSPPWISGSMEKTAVADDEEEAGKAQVSYITV